MPRSLHGATVVVTRASHQAGDMVDMLVARGARVIEMPLIAVEEPADSGRRRDAVLATLDEFDWVVVTSPNGASRLAPHLGSAGAGRDARGPRIAAVGRATEAALGRPADLVAEPARAAVLAEVFPRGSGRVLVVKGDLADDTVTRGIADAGWDVTDVVAYRTVTVVPDPALAVGAREADVLMLASGSAARAWVAAFGTRTPPVVVCIGPSTEAAARESGIAVTVTAPNQSTEEMVRCAEQALAGW